MEAKTCLVLEGGALRGVYTSGVQGVLHRSGLSFDCVIGTSAGAMNGVNYLSGQPERTFYIDYNFARDKQFIGLRPLLREGQIFSFRYLFSFISEMFPFEMETFLSSPSRYIAVASDLETGAPAYLEKGFCDDILAAISASSSIPLLSTSVEVNGRRYYDGGPAIPVAYQKALDEGYEKVVLVLTRQKGYRKPPFSPLSHLAMKRKFRKHPAYYEMLLSSPVRYNRMMDEIDRLEAEGTLFVVRPSQPVVVSRTEKDLQKLEQLFLQGREDMQVLLPALGDYLSIQEADDIR